MASLTTAVTARINATHTATAPVLDLATTATAQSVLVDKLVSISLATGTAAGQSDLMFSDTRTLAASATESLDLAGSLTDAFGATLTFARVKAILVLAAAANTNSVVVGAAASNQWSTALGTAGTVTLRPGGVMLLAAGVADATGWAVTAGTGDLLKIANSSSGSSVDYDIVVIGASA